MLRRWWLAVRRWWVNPAPSPEKIGKGDAHKHRPIPIELGFHLHADGTVYHRRRDGDGDRRVTNPEIVGAVHAEYRALVTLARRKARRAELMRRFFSRQ